MAFKDERSAPRIGVAAAIAMAAGGCCSGLVFAPVAPIIPLIAQNAGGGASGAFAAQMSMAAPGIGLVFGGLLSGVLVDRYGTRKTLIPALAAFILFGGAGLFVEGVLALAISRFLLGMAAAMIFASADSFIGATFSDIHRGRALGIIGAVSSAVALLSNYFSGWIGTQAGWHGPFIIYPLMGILFLSCAWLGTPAAIRRPATENVTTPFVRNLLPVYLLITSLYVGLMMANTQLGLLLAERGIESPMMISIVIGMGPLLTIMASSSYGWLLTRMRISSLFALGLLLLGCGLLIVGIFHSVYVVSIGIALKGIASGLLNPFLAHIVLNRAPAHARGRALGFMTSAMYLGNFINPLVVTPLKMSFGLSGAFLIIGLVMVAGAVIATITTRRQAA